MFCSGGFLFFNLGKNPFLTLKNLFPIFIWAHLIVIQSCFYIFLCLHLSAPLFELVFLKK